MQPRRITIVGGGITGLAAAWELSTDPDVLVEVLEAGPRFGGKIQSSRLAGIELEEGADAFLIRTPDAVNLCAELGIGQDQLIHPRQGSASVWWEGALHPLPHGLVMGLPVDPAALRGTDLLSDEGRSRAEAEPHQRGLPLDSDRAIGAFVTERFGSEVTDRLVAPLLGAIAAGDVNTMSLDAVLPQIAEVARCAPSLTGNVVTPVVTDPPTPVFAAPHGGMARLIDELVHRLRSRRVTLRLDEPVGDVADLDADGAVLTTPAFVSARLLGSATPAAAEILAAIPHVSVAFLAFAFDPSDVTIPLDGTGFLVPRVAGLSITAASWSSSKWAHLAAPDRVVVRAAIGHRHDHQVDHADDATLVDAALADLHTTMGITAPPIESRVTRYLRAFPQYDVGHLDRVAGMHDALRRDAPHLAVAGMALRGVGIPACIGSGRAEARSLAVRLAS